MIEVKNVVKKYGKVTALNGATFNIKEGRVTGILGINGVGKSTVLKAIMGLIPIKSGEILIDGELLTEKTYDKLAFIADVPTYYPGMTIEEIFQFMDTFYRLWDKDKAYKMLTYFKLDKKKKIAELSKGNIARVKVILGYSQKSKYLLMDEPFSGMDIFTREAFIETMMGEFAEDGQALIITTHEIAEIEHIVDDVIILENGQVVSSFSAEKVREEEGKSIVDVMREVYRNA